jgi:hypothetical protein
MFFKNLNALNTKKEVKSILVVRSAPLKRTFEALRKLREEFPWAEISIVTQPEVRERIERSGFVNRIVGISTGKIRAFRYLPLIFQMRREKFDMVVIIYNIPIIREYTNLHLFCHGIGAKRNVRMIDGSLQEFNVRDVFFEVFKENLKLFLLTYYIILFIFLIPLLILFCLRRYKFFWQFKVRG